MKRASLSLLTVLAAVVAGCAGGADERPADVSPPDDAPAAGNPSALQAQALALYDDAPFRTTSDVSAANTPAHVWLLLDDDHLQLLHWNHDDPARADALLFTGDGFRGRFCVGPSGVSPEQYEAGFVHFHTAEAPSWDAGHNAGGHDGDPGTEGWWLRHVGAADATMAMMGETMRIRKGETFPLMAAGLENVPSCPEGDHAHGEGGSAGASTALRDQLLGLYVSRPFATTSDVTEHDTPAHVWLQTDEDRLAFLHWNHDDPTRADALLFTGDGFRGRFCLGAAGVTQEEHDSGFVHFHTAVAPNWDAGHNAGGHDGDPQTEGWWLRHLGAADGTMTMMGQEMTIEKGEVFHLMPAGLDDLQRCEG